MELGAVNFKDIVTFGMATVNRFIFQCCFKNEHQATS